MIKWFGTITNIIGAFTVAYHMFLVGYICFTLGSVAWLYIGIKGNDKPLILLNGVFLIANILGLYNAVL